MKEDSIPARTTLLVLLLALLWGGNVVAIKIGLRGIPPFAAAGIRFGIALPLIALWARMRRISLKPRAGEAIPLLIVGLIFTAQISFLNLGARLTLAGRATVILHTYPVFVAFLAHFIVPGDRLSWYRLIGVPLFFMPHALFEGGSAFGFPPAVVAALLYQGVVVGVFYFLTWFSILKRHSPSRLTILFFTAPLWGLLASYLLLAEGISICLVIGAGMEALGIFLVNRR